ncbi:MAG: 50S ribosomal protein L17 [Deltaproteobacteria bacterium]|nr:MAG: 50S ribosomal protein L17 [Deltaproteobacteria bacterium]
MRHAKRSRRFGRPTGHRQAMFRNLVTSLLVHERITTTVEKAKEIRRLAEKLITLGKRGDLHARRLAASRLYLTGLREGKVVTRQQVALKKLFADLAPRYKNRQGGYTRIVKLGQRRGDGARMALIELIPEEAKPASRKKSKGGSKAKSKAKS